jgi:hypothetical protein
MILPVLSADRRLCASRSSNAPVACKRTSRRRPPAARFNFLERRRSQPPREFVPDLCQRIADLDGLAGLVRRKNNKLRGINDGGGIDSVPSHHFQ